MADDHTNTIDTTGAVAVGGSATGNIETAQDRDWLAVELEAGRTYRFDLKGSPTGDGTLSDTFLRRILDADGDKSVGDGAHATYNDDFGGSRNSQVTFTAKTSGTYYVETSGDRNETGTYTLSVTDVTSAAVPDEPAVVDPPAVVSDPDGTRAGAQDLGDITALEGVRFPRDSLDGDGDRVDYYRFTLTEAKAVGLGLRQQDANADLYLEDAEGNVLHGSTAAGTANEWVSATVLAGTYYVRVEAKEAGANAHVLRYGVSEADADEVARLQAQQSDPPASVPDTDAVRAGASELSLAARAAVVTGSVDGIGDAVDYHRFTLTETWQVDLMLYGSSGDGNLGRDADLYLEDAGGSVLAHSAAEGRGRETVQQVLAEGTYYVRVEAKQAGTNDYKLNAFLWDAPQVEVSDAEGHESDDGVVRFRVSLARAAVNPVTVRYETVDATALAGEDYESASGTLTFAVGETEQWVEVTLIDDTEEDSGETFSLRLSEVTGAVLGDADGTGTILNTEATPVSISEPSGTDFAADATTDGRVVAGESATGEITAAGDVDWFAVEMQVGMTYRLDLLGSDLGQGTLADPYLRGVHDAEGNLLPGTQNNDRHVWFYRSSRMDFTPEADGTYYVAAGANGGQTGTYRLSVTGYADDHAGGRSTTGTVAVGGAASGEVEIAEDRDWFAVELEAGRTYRIDLEGRDTDHGTLTRPWLDGIHDAHGTVVPGTTSANGGEGRNARVVFTPEAGGTYYVAAGASESRTGTYRVSVADITDIYPAYTHISAEVAVGGTASGKLESAGDRDWFAVELEAGQHYRFDLEGRDTGHGTLRDPHLYGIHDSQGNRLSGTTGDDGGHGRNARVDFAPEADGTYYVSAGAGGSRDVGTYRLSVEPCPWELGVADVEAKESSREMYFRVVLNWASPTPVTVSYETVDGTAIAGEDYEAESGTLTFAPGETEKRVRVNLHDDFVEDSGETLTLRLSDTSGAALVDGEAVGTILNNEVEARTIAVGRTAEGGLSNRDEIDWFKVALEAGNTYQLDTAGRGFPPNVKGVYDSLHNQLPLTKGDWPGRAFFTPETDATYFVALGSANRYFGQYRFSVTTVPDDDYGDAPRNADPDALAPGTLTVGSSATGRIETPYDRDWFAVELEAGQAYRFEQNGSEGGQGSLVDPKIRGLYDSDGSYINGTSNDRAPLIGYHAGSTGNAKVYYTPEESGTYYLSADTNRGEVGTYRVLARAVADDYLHNTDTTGTVTVGGTTDATIDYPGDTDWFAVTLMAGRRYRVDLECDARCDPILRGVYDSTGEYLDGTRNGDGGTGDNSRVYFTPATDGTYYIAASAEAYNCEGNTGPYELSVTNVTPDDFSASTDTTGEVIDQPGPEYKPGDPLTFRPATGDIERPGDVDWFAVILEVGKSYQIDLEGSETDEGTLSDPYLGGIYDTNSDLIAGTTNDNGGEGNNARVTFAPSKGGTYYIAADAVSDDTGTYTLSVEEVL